MPSTVCPQLKVHAGPKMRALYWDKLPRARAKEGTLWGSTLALAVVASGQLPEGEEGGEGGEAEKEKEKETAVGAAKGGLDQ